MAIASSESNLPLKTISIQRLTLLRRKAFLALKSWMLLCWPCLIQHANHSSLSTLFSSVFLTSAYQRLYSKLPSTLWSTKVIVFNLMFRNVLLNCWRGHLDWLVDHYSWNFIHGHLCHCHFILSLWKRSLIVRSWHFIIYLHCSHFPD